MVNVRRRKMALIPLALLAAPGGLAVSACTALGHSPRAEDEAAYRHLTYFREGRFQSPEEVPHYPDRETGPGPSGWSRFLLPNRNAPEFPLRQVALTASSFPANPAGLAVYWLGHASLIIEFEGKRLAVDPVFGNAAPAPGIVRRFGDAPIDRDDLPALDYVLITHDHYDHLEYATMRALRKRAATRFIVPLGVGAHLREWGIPSDRISEIGWGEAFEQNGLAVASERTIHFSGRTFGNRNATLWTSYAIKGRKYRLFVCGDSGYGGHFKEAGAKHGPFDLAFIEIDGWNPGWPKTHMFPEEVIRAYRDLNARALLPVHWGVFDLARHPWDESIGMIADLASQAGDVVLLTPLMGEKLVPGETATGAWWKNAARNS
ncbi:MAG: MBL fold metallo-hydrolase [Candidatus Accumulibacter sp.]|nr:MBL fold metallo-hydrolase [Accumulibacter sp.]